MQQTGENWVKTWFNFPKKQRCTQQPCRHTFMKTNEMKKQIWFLFFSLISLVFVIALWELGMMQLLHMAESHVLDWFCVCVASLFIQNFITFQKLVILQLVVQCFSHLLNTFPTQSDSHCSFRQDESGFLWNLLEIRELFENFHCYLKLLQF